MLSDFSGVERSRFPAPPSRPPSNKQQHRHRTPDRNNGVSCRPWETATHITGAHARPISGVWHATCRQSDNPLAAEGWSNRRSAPDGLFEATRKAVNMHTVSSQFVVPCGLEKLKKQQPDGGWNWHDFSTLQFAATNKTKWRSSEITKRRLPGTSGRK